MNPPPENWRLCRLIDESLSLLSLGSLESSELITSKKIEKQLLISLSQVFKQIQQWTNDYDSDSDDVMKLEIIASNSKSSSEADCPCDNHDCLTKIIGDLIPLLSVESPFVQHLAGNILIAIFDYLAALESNWSRLMKLLCICLELAISNALSCSLNRPQCSNHEMSHEIIALQPKLKLTTWSSVACVIRILRNILKRMKQDIDNEFLENYLNSISGSLANLPWDAMDQNWNAIGIFSNHLEDKTGKQNSMSVFHGTLVQLFCSLINLNNCKGADKSFSGHPVISQISNLVPTLLDWCLGGHNRNNIRMLEYFGHKILMLMIRLSSVVDLEDSIIFSWLVLIHKYFEDLLMLPIDQPDQENTLEDSPFITSKCDSDKRVYKSRHLQRLAVLLFLKCSFSLISLTDRRAKQRNNISELKCSTDEKGLSELNWWLRIHLPPKMLGDSDCYLERCTGFSISFLRLFIHEDDILFELLLLLFCVPFHAKQKAGQDIWLQETNEDVLFNVSNILNPLQLFHLFLSELHYDHQVLLDYLISKDTGTPFAEYLLRSLRIACDSWTEFVEYSLEGEVIDMGVKTKLSGKKRKILADGSNLRARVSSFMQKDDNIPSSFGKHHQEAILHSDIYANKFKQPFEKAKDCLLLLEKTIKNLHQKKLFPYNPKVLLRRLARFQELCSKH